MDDLIRGILNFISSNDLLGLVPLDVIAHLLVGSALILILRFMKIKPIGIFVVIFLIAIGKEISDNYSYNGGIVENIKDVFVTMIPMMFFIMCQVAKESAEARKYVPMDNNYSDFVRDNTQIVSTYTISFNQKTRKGIVSIGEL